MKNVSRGSSCEQTCESEAFANGDLGVSTPASEGHVGLKASEIKLVVIFAPLRKSSCFNDIWMPFCTYSKPFEKTALLGFGSYLKE